MAFQGFRQGWFVLTLCGLQRFARYGGLGVNGPSLSASVEGYKREALAGDMGLPLGFAALSERCHLDGFWTINGFAGTESSWFGANCLKRLVGRPRREHGTNGLKVCLLFSFHKSTGRQNCRPVLLCLSRGFSGLDQKPAESMSVANSLPASPGVLVAPL